MSHYIEGSVQEKCNSIECKKNVTPLGRGWGGGGGGGWGGGWGGGVSSRERVALKILTNTTGYLFAKLPDYFEFHGLLCRLNYTEGCQSNNIETVS